MFVGRATQFSSAGAIATGERLCLFILTPAAAAATCSIKEGGTGGSVVLSLSAPANGASVQVGPIQIRDPYLSAIAGASATFHVVM